MGQNGKTVASAEASEQESHCTSEGEASERSRDGPSRNRRPADRPETQPCLDVVWRR